MSAHSKLEHFPIFGIFSGRVRAAFGPLCGLPPALLRFNQAAIQSEPPI